MKKFFQSDSFRLIVKMIVTLLIVIALPYIPFLLMLVLYMGGYWQITVYMSLLILPALLVLIWIKKKKPFGIAYLSYLLIFAILILTQDGINAYNRSITIDVTPNINVYEYLPYKEDSNIVKIQSELLDFSNVPAKDLPIIDGAAAAFPVYSAFVHAVYPQTTRLNDGIFEYNNTQTGYHILAKKRTDIFIGAAPSVEQIDYAQENGTTFAYTQIGSEAFVFFVHKDNPIESLTVEQIKGIYSGEITNWSQLGGNNEKIVPFQRNEGSGSQSMFLRIMGNAPVLEPNMKTQVGSMGGIIEEVADYKNKTSSIGFSFRYYVEGIIKHPDIKIIAIDGVAPTVENIKSNTYPFIAPVYAVTYEGNPKENVHKLINWMLSDEGQYIIEQTGYVGVNTK